MGLEKRDSRTFATIIADGTIRVKCEESTEGAVKREYEVKGEKGFKWELVYDSLSGIINGIEFKEGKFGKQLNVIVDDIVLTMNLKSNYSESLMKILPNVEFSNEVKISPYNFTDDKGKNRRGVSLKQNDIKLANFFWDTENKKNLHDLPEVDQEASKTYDSDDWAVYYTTVRKFLQKYTEENVFPKIDGGVVADAEVSKDATMEEIKEAAAEPEAVSNDPVEDEANNNGLNKMFA